MGRKSCLDPVETQVIYLGLGGGKVQGEFPVGFSSAKEDSQAKPAVVRLRLFFPLAKH